MRAWFSILAANLALASAVAAGPVHDAAKTGDVATIAAALGAGADINDSDGTATPLHYAVASGNMKAAELLLAHGAKVSAPSIWGPPLLVAALNGRADMIKLLLAKGADPDGHFRSKTALHIASQKGYLDCVVTLVEAGADVNALMTSGDTPVHLAKSGKHQDVAEYLIAHGVTQPKPEPISTKLSTADAILGRKAFEINCEKCHFAEPEKGRKVGPNLWGVVGRERASMPGIYYSDALKSWHGVWTYEDLNAFLWKPKVTVPGVLMEIAGVDDETERVNLIAYLRTLSDGPEPLP
jgi:cytochrome c